MEVSVMAINDDFDYPWGRGEDRDKLSYGVFSLLDGKRAFVQATLVQRNQAEDYAQFLNDQELGLNAYFVEDLKTGQVTWTNF